MRQRVEALIAIEQVGAGAAAALAEDPELSLVVDLLDVFLRARAREAEIAPSYLGSRHDLAALIVDDRAAAGGDVGGLALLAVLLQVTQHLQRHQRG